MEKLMSIPDAARALCVSPWTVRCWLSQKRLAKVKVGRRTVVEERELQRFLAEQNSPASKKEA